jgi:hypothetical protein
VSSGTGSAPSSSCKDAWQDGFQSYDFITSAFGEMEPGNILFLKITSFNYQGWTKKLLDNCAISL